MEIIEKKVYEEGQSDRNRSTRERANAGLTLGIIGTVLGGAALWGGRNGGLGSLLSGGGGTSAGSIPSNVNINTYGGGGGCIAPTPFEVYEKSCADAIKLTEEFYGLILNEQKSATQAREIDIAEKFGLYKEQINADFNLYKDNRDNIDGLNNRINNELFSLYKYTRDKDDETSKELSDLKARVAQNEAIRPYQDKLIQCEIDKAFTAALTALERRTCKMIEGVLCLPNEPTVTGFVGNNCCFRQSNTGGSTQG